MIEVIASIGLVFVTIIGKSVIREPTHYKELLNIAVAVSTMSVVIIKFFFFQAKNYYTDIKKRLRWLSGLTILYATVCCLEFIYFTATIASRTTPLTSAMHVIYYVLSVVMFAIYKKNYLFKYSVYGKTFLIHNIIEIIIFAIILIINFIYNKRDISIYVVMWVIFLFLLLAYTELRISKKKDYWLNRKTLKTNIYVMAKLHIAGDYDSIIRYFYSKRFLALCNQVLSTSFLRKRELNRIKLFIRKKFIKCNFSTDESEEIAKRFAQIATVNLMNRKYDTSCVPNFIAKWLTEKRNDRRGKKNEQE